MKVPEQYIVLVRRGIHAGVLHVTGSLHCDTCRGPAMSQAQLARAIGVSPSQLSAFLNRRPVRTDVADKIRASVLRVEE